MNRRIVLAVTAGLLPCLAMTAPRTGPEQRPALE